jgi:hypothetical protein
MDIEYENQVKKMQLTLKITRLCPLFRGYYAGPMFCIDLYILVFFDLFL